MSNNCVPPAAHPYNQRPPYCDSDDDDESIDYPSSDEEEIEEESTPPPKEPTPIQRSQALRKEILKILKR